MRSHADAQGVGLYRECEDTTQLRAQGTWVMCLEQQVALSGLARGSGERGERSALEPTTSIY